MDRLKGELQLKIFDRRDNAIIQHDNCRRHVANMDKNAIRAV